MKENSFKIMMLSLIIIMAVLLQVSPGLAGVLDGKAFMGQSGEKGKDASGEDTVSFQDGKLHSVECDQWGFGNGEYTTMIDGNVTHFEAETISPKSGKIVWKGAVEGITLNATYTWTKKRLFWTTKKEIWVRGTLN